MVLKNHIKNLQETTIEFRGTLCDTCHQPLSMPALYFLCQHSYHQEWVANEFLRKIYIVTSLGSSFRQSQSWGSMLKQLNNFSVILQLRTGLFWKRQRLSRVSHQKRSVNWRPARSKWIPRSARVVSQSTRSLNGTIFSCRRVLWSWTVQQNRFGGRGQWRGIRSMWCEIIHQHQWFVVPFFF